MLCFILTKKRRYSSHSWIKMVPFKGRGRRGNRRFPYREGSKGNRRFPLQGLTADRVHQPIHKIGNEIRNRST